MSFSYPDQFYNSKSPAQIVPIVNSIIAPNSVLDVGCGIGTWLKAFKNLGVQETIGIDGKHVSEKEFLLNYQNFHAFDITKPLQLNKKFDLVMSLEVAEHIPVESTDTFIQNLIVHGDTILFSCAVPGQGGNNHVNEQWPSYWKTKFEALGFHLYDILRPRIWENEEIIFWYRQNIFIISKSTNNKLNRYGEAHSALDLVHPELYNFHLKQSRRCTQLENGELGFSLAFNAFIKSLGNLLKK